MRADSAQPIQLSDRALADFGTLAGDRRQGEFDRLLGIAKSPKEPGEAEARDAAEQLVALVLVEPILAQVRESNQAAPPFAPTSGEKQFQAMIDARLARELTQAARFPLVERLARDLRRGQRTEAQNTPTLRA